MAYEYASHPDMRDDYTMDQKWDEYTDTDHDVWRRLFERQMEILPGRVYDEFLRSVERLQFTPDKIPNFEELSDILEPLTGWRIVATAGLIPGTHFFNHLANRRFPVTFWIRKPEEIDYLEEPDLFHDLFGHVPLLSNPVFADYIAAYGRGGVKALNLKAVKYITRLFWYTVEFGLINTPEGRRFYGAGIASSPGESKFALESDSPNHLAFDIERMMQTATIIDDYQQSYFVIDSLEQLFNATKPDFTDYYNRLRPLPTLDPGEIQERDIVLQKGTGDYARERAKEKQKDAKSY